MRRNTSVLASFFVFALLFFLFSQNTSAQDTFVPAGTLLRCTMSEPNFSSASAQVGDPVLCHLGAVQVFGHNVFPRGAYMGGHLEAEKEPGHFFGKGYLKIVFDRIALPNSELPLDTKIVALRSYHVDKEGDIKGKGHAKRDVVEWMIPPLWPWKVLMLPARGPRPTLKGEQILTLRLMEDVTVPKFGATYNSRDWRAPHAQNFAQPSAFPSPRRLAPASATPNSTTPTPVTAPPLTNMPAATENASTVPVATMNATMNANYVTSVDPGYAPRPQTPRPIMQQPAHQPEISQSNAARKTLTLLALRNETI